MSTLTSREFNQDTGRAKKEALSNPVYITDRGKLSYVLLSYKDYNKILKNKETIGEMLSMKGVEDIEFIPELLSDKPSLIEF